MSKFKELILETLQELQEAPAQKQQQTSNQSAPKNNTQSVQTNQQQPEQQNNSSFYIKASGHAMKQYAGQDFYFHEFETEQDGSKRPLFLGANFKKYSAKFPTEQEAQNTLNQIYQEAPVYKSLFQTIQVVPEEEGDTTDQVNTQDQPLPDDSNNTEENPENTQDDNNQGAWSKFKSFVTKAKEDTIRSFQTLDDFGKKAVQTTANVLNGKSSGNPQIDNIVKTLKNTIAQTTPKKK